jgi:hypothetical protein
MLDAEEDLEGREAVGDDYRDEQEQDQPDGDDGRGGVRGPPSPRPQANPQTGRPATRARGGRRDPRRLKSMSPRETVDVGDSDG